MCALAVRSWMQKGSDRAHLEYGPFVFQTVAALRATVLVGCVRRAAPAVLSGRLPAVLARLGAPHAKSIMSIPWVAACPTKFLVSPVAPQHICMPALMHRDIVLIH